MRLANNEPGLSRALVKELRDLGQEKANAPSATGEQVMYATLATESPGVKEQREREEGALREKKESSTPIRR